MSRWPLLCLLWGLAAPVVAGHGLMNAFSDIEWLPAPGRTPDRWDYFLDRWREALQWRRAASDDVRFRLALRCARERLAEAEAMLRQRDSVAAGVALAGYARDVARAEALSARHPIAMARALLEHGYMLSTDYLDLPREQRVVLLATGESIAARYANVRERLPPGQREGLFFKEEEVRWSWQTARQADAQGL